MVVNLAIIRQLYIQVGVMLEQVVVVVLVLLVLPVERPLGKVEAMAV
jgi:hypothetical protein